MSFVSSSAFIAILFLLSLGCLFQPPHPPHHHPHHYRHFRSGNTELCTVCTILRFPFLKDFSYYSMEAGQEQRIVPESCWHSSVAHLEKRTERALSDDALSGHVTQYSVVGGGGGGSHIHETILLCLAVSFIMFYRPTVDTHGYSFLLISVELNSSYIFVFVVIEIELGISQLLSKQALHPQLWLHHSWVPLYHVHLATC